MISHFRCLACQSNQIFRPFQLPIKVPDCVAEIILLFGDECRISKSVHGSNQTTHLKLPRFDGHED